MASSEKCRCRASLPFRSCWRRDGTSATCCTRTRSADRTSPPFDESPDPPRIGVSRTSSPKQGSLKARDVESPSANYEELVKTQSVLNRKHLGVAALRTTAGLALGLALRGPKNFIPMVWEFGSGYSRDPQDSDHLQPRKYSMRPPEAPRVAPPPTRDLFIHLRSPAPRAH